MDDSNNNPEWVDPAIEVARQARAAAISERERLAKAISASVPSAKALKAAQEAFVRSNAENLKNVSEAMSRLTAIDLPKIGPPRGLGAPPARTVTTNEIEQVARRLTPSINAEVVKAVDAQTEAIHEQTAALVSLHKETVAQNIVLRAIADALGKSHIVLKWTLTLTVAVPLGILLIGFLAR